MDTNTLDGTHQSFEDAFETADAPDGQIERRATGIRTLLTLLFAVIWGVLEVALAVLAVFSLAYALITRLPPPLRVRNLSNQVVAYSYRVWRYITYNEMCPPFPFRDFPDALEPPPALGPGEEREVARMYARDDESDDYDRPRDLADDSSRDDRDKSEEVR